MRVVASRGFKLGDHAELMAVPETGAVAAIPAGVSDADAVAVFFGGITALSFFAVRFLRLSRRASW